MAGEHYSAFVAEAFIKPIRSVLIVDDDYPTFEEMLDAEIARNTGGEPRKEKQWHTDPSRIKKVIESFRRPERSLLVDIHDGSNVPSGDERRVAAHLHQSDLLVLDYQLDRSKPNDGTLAIEILRTLMLNDHFNLVVVHTSENLEAVFRQTLIGLLSSCGDWLKQGESEEVETLLEAAEDSHEGVIARLKQSIGEDQYIYARKDRLKYLRVMGHGEQPYSTFRHECSQVVSWRPNVYSLILRYFLKAEEDKLNAQLNAAGAPPISWSDGSCKYIRSDSSFIAFSAKGDDDDLLSDLLAALNAWCPPPSRLFLSRLRAEMEEYGVAAETAALESYYALAHWYKRLLDADGESRRWLISESIGRHSDQLMDGILPRVEEFARRLVEVEAADSDHDEISYDHFKVDLRKADEKLKAVREHNAFVCSKPPEGWHLNTGHVFKIEDDFWVCVSPACDMVPAQLSTSRIETLGKRLPFMAVKLRPISDTKPLSDVQSNRYLFLRQSGLVSGFCFNDPGNDNSAPTWHTLYAENKGEFSGNFSFDVLVPQQGGQGLEYQRRETRVVAQLRYEYALNLVQRLGGTLTRIGLDFA